MQRTILRDQIFLLDFSLKTLTLEAGEPIAYLTPLGDVKLKVKTELVSHERWNQMLKHRFTFTNIMPKIKKFIMRRK